MSDSKPRPTPDVWLATAMVLAGSAWFFWGGVILLVHEKIMQLPTVPFLPYTYGPGYTYGEDDLREVQRDVFISLLLMICQTLAVFGKREGASFLIAYGFLITGVVCNVLGLSLLRERQGDPDFKPFWNAILPFLVFGSCLLIGASMYCWGCRLRRYARENQKCDT